MKTSTHPIVRTIPIVTLCTTLLFATSPSHAGLIAYEGFNYTANATIEEASDLNGGSGWNGPWRSSGATNVTGPYLSIIEAGSLTYTDGLGNALTTSGGKMLNQGDPANNVTSRPGRALNAAQGADGTTTWISFLGVRLGANLVRGANLTLFNITNYTIQAATDTNATALALDTNGRLAIGENSGVAADVWTIAPNGASGQRRSSALPFNTQAFVVIRIDHRNDGQESVVSTNDSDTAYIWLNPNLNVTPDVSTAFTNINAGPDDIGPTPRFHDFAFDTVVMFAGGLNGGNDAAQWHVDEIRVGTTFADVAPFTPGSGSVQSRFTNVQPSGSDISLTFTGAVSTVYTILGATNLTQTPWNTLGTTTTSGSGVGTFTDTNTLNSRASRFYRAQQ